MGVKCVVESALGGGEPSKSVQGHLSKRVDAEGTGFLRQVTAVGQGSELVV